MASDQLVDKGLGKFHKVVILGDSGVGKTTLFYRIKDGYFRESGVSTTQIDQFIKPYASRGGEVQLQFVDTAGFETYHSSIPHSMLRDTNAILFVFSLDDSASFTHLKHWYEETLEATPSYQSDKIVKFMVGNKVDLHRKVDQKRIANTATSAYGIREDDIFEISAKDGSNVDNLVESLVEKFSTAKPHKPKTVKTTSSSQPVKLCRCL